MIAAAILTITYGLDIQEKGDPNIAMADKALKHLDVAFIGTYMVDVLPFLRNLPRWMPGAGFQTTGESSRHDLRLMVELLYAKARKLLVRVLCGIARRAAADSGLCVCIARRSRRIQPHPSGSQP